MATVEMPKWNDEMAGLRGRPEDYVREFKRFCRFQASGYEPLPQNEQQLLLTAVPMETLAGAQMRTEMKMEASFYQIP